MNSYKRKFLKQSDKVSNDLKHRETIKFNMAKYKTAVEKGEKRFANIELGREYIAAKKRQALSKLDKELTLFEANAKKNGVKVLWAEDSKAACSLIFNIIKQNANNLIVKSKSMTTEEIDLNEYLEHRGINSVETDLGEYIVQVAGEKPYHIVTPAMHKSKNDINELFTKHFGIDKDLSAEELTNFVRVKLRSLYQEADVGITGANFLVADTGGIAVTENEGNAIFSTAFPKIHIAIAGIEKIIPSINDLDLFWPLLSTHGTGQAITVYNSIFTGPRRKDEDFGPEQMYVILLDNKRTSLLGTPPQNDVLACIRCGACLNACPVYHNIGGYTYNTTYGGPIGSVISPFYNNFDFSGHLSFACTICGKCTEVCPSKIDLHSLLLHNRNLEVSKHKTSFIFKIMMKGYKFAALNPAFFDLGLNGIKNFFKNTIGRNIFGKKRALPNFKKSFRKSYIKYKKE